MTRPQHQRRVVHRPKSSGPSTPQTCRMPLTRAARRGRAVCLDHLDDVASRGELGKLGVGWDHIAAQLAADRWRRIGTAIVLHNGVINRAQAERVALINCGPRAVLTSFTAAAHWGLQNWGRPEIHVMAPAGTSRPKLRGLVLHRTADWSNARVARGRRLHLLAPALLVAASSFPTSRPGCGILAAAVQQRLLGAADLRGALHRAPRLRHRATLLLAVGDIEQGAHALSEIDFARLCARHGLPKPTRQAVRTDSAGRRRYLDAEWELPGGRRVAVEVDGALHLRPRQWIDDQLRQNEIVIGGTLVLRYPSIVVRDQPELIVAQLRRVLVGR